MTKRDFGKAEYKAYRSGELVRLLAHGIAPNFNTKPDFQQMPWRIYPPHYGFYFITPEIMIPTLRPFTYEELVAFPRGVSAIPVVDADGGHLVDIEEVSFSPLTFELPNPKDKGYCVFADLMTDQQRVAKCDAILVGMPPRVFGPATYGECMEYIASRKS